MTSYKDQQKSQKLTDMARIWERIEQGLNGIEQEKDAKIKKDDEDGE